MPLCLTNGSLSQAGNPFPFHRTKRYSNETSAYHAGSVNGVIDPALWELLSAQGRVAESFPGDFSAALLSGRVTAEVLSRYLELEANLLVKLVWGIQGGS